MSRPSELAQDDLRVKYNGWLERVLSDNYVFTLADSLDVTEMLQDHLDYLDLLIDEIPTKTDFRVTFTYNDDPRKIRMENIDAVADAIVEVINYD